MGITNNKESQHCGTKPKKFAFGIAPLGIVSIGIVPMGVISIGVVPMGVFSFGAVAMGIVNLSVVGMGIISAGITTMGLWEYSPKSQSHNHHSTTEQISNIPTIVSLSQCIHAMNLDPNQIQIFISSDFT